MNIDSLLDKAAEKCNAKNDSQLARALKVTPGAVNNYRQGVSAPNAVVCEKIAELAGVPLVKVIGIAGEQRALSREEKAVWRRVAEAAAACFLIAVNLSYFAAPAIASISRNHGSMHIMFRRLRELARGRRVKFGPIGALNYGF